MRNVTKRADGRYMARVQKDHKVFTVYARSTKQIEMKLRALKKDVKNAVIERTKFTLYEWSDYWYITYKKNFISEQTKIGIENVLKHLREHFKDIPLNEYSTQMIQNTLNKYPANRRKELLILYLSAMWKKAVETEIISKNPMLGVVKEKQQKNTRSPFTLQQQTDILEAIQKTDIEVPIMLFLLTGIRRNEYEGTKIIKSINNNMLKIKNEKKRNNEESYRYIDLSEKATKYFLTHSGYFDITSELLYRKFSKVLKTLKIKGSLHTLRHTFTTNHFYLGTPVKMVSYWLGHETVELTQNIYTHIDRSIKKEEIKELYQGMYFEV